MSVLSDKIAEVDADADQAIARVQEDVTALQAKIAELEGIVANGTATPEDMARLDSLKTKLEALDPVSPTTLPQ